MKQQVRRHQRDQRIAYTPHTHSSCRRTVRLLLLLVLFLLLALLEQSWTCHLERRPCCLSLWPQLDNVGAAVHRSSSTSTAHKCVMHEITTPQGCDDCQEVKTVALGQLKLHACISKKHEIHAPQRGLHATMHAVACSTETLAKSRTRPHKNTQGVNVCIERTNDGRKD